ncbi:MAG: hypothetical protein WAQ27_00740, partial [Candidatus Microsaccharimonas sp.]
LVLTAGWLQLPLALLIAFNVVMILMAPAEPVFLVISFGALGALVAFVVTWWVQALRLLLPLREPSKKARGITPRAAMDESV